MTLWDGSFAASILALSVTACAVPPLPKGETLAKPKTVPLCQGLPLRGSWRAATERARTLKYAAAVSLYDPTRENAFGAARRACRGNAPPSANADRSAA